MYKLQTCKMLSLIAAVALLFGCTLVSAQAQSYSFHVNINTSALSGVLGRLTFDLTDGDGTPGNNTATVSGFATTGTLAGGGNINTIQGGFESINRNANLSPSPSPRSDAGYASVDPHVRLHTPNANAVPAPAGLLLGLTGLPALGLAGWVRRRRAAIGV